MSIEEVQKHLGQEAGAKREGARTYFSHQIQGLAKDEELATG
jgi:hypothetical protein